jgi:hypothetical protein
MQAWHTNGRSSNIPVRKASERKSASEESSVLKVGKWPVSKSELTNRYLKQLLRYIKSRDLEKINQM